MIYLYLMLDLIFYFLYIYKFHILATTRVGDPSPPSIFNGNKNISNYLSTNYSKFLKFYIITIPDYKIILWFLKSVDVTQSTDRQSVPTPFNFFATNNSAIY
jgi:hypothetical protein